MLAFDEIVDRLRFADRDINHHKDLSLLDAVLELLELGVGHRARC